MKLFGQYGFSEGVRTSICLLITKLFWPKARLIRKPLYLRGKEHLSYGAGLTTGYCCRFDLAGEGVTLTIGKDCRMNDRVHIVAHKRVTIGNNVLMASNIFISDTSHGASKGENQTSPFEVPNMRQLISSPVIIGDRVWIGENVSILPGVSIGDGAIIGAGSVVTHNVESNTIVVGSPARVIKKWDPKSRSWRTNPEYLGLNE